MGKSEKIMVGSAIGMLGAAFLLWKASKTIKESADSVVSSMMNVRFSLSETKKEVIDGNSKVEEASRILRKLVKDEL